MKHELVSRPTDNAECIDLLTPEQRDIARQRKATILRETQGRWNGVPYGERLPSFQDLVKNTELGEEEAARYYEALDKIDRLD